VTGITGGNGVTLNTKDAELVCDTRPVQHTTSEPDRADGERVSERRRRAAAVGPIPLTRSPDSCFGGRGAMTAPGRTRTTRQRESGRQDVHLPGVLDQPRLRVLHAVGTLEPRQAEGGRTHTDERRVEQRRGRL
jgi:hypothetical protein